MWQIKECPLTVGVLKANEIFTPFQSHITGFGFKNNKPVVWISCNTYDTSTNKRNLRVVDHTDDLIGEECKVIATAVHNNKAYHLIER